MSEERVDPRISVNKLGEYLVALPARRRRIVTEAKHPRPFIVTRYREASEAMVAFLEQGANDESTILDAIDMLERKAVTSEFQEQDRLLSIEALESFLDMTDYLDLEDLEMQRGEQAPPHLNLGDLSISVRPDLITCQERRDGQRAVGAVKIYLSKTHPLTQQAGEYIGVILQQFGEQNLQAHGVCDYRLCRTLDVFAQETHRAPRSYRRRQTNIEAACQEIALTWGVV